MPLGLQIAWLFILAVPIACIAWTVTHEEVFREPRDYCARKSQSCRRLLERKFFYLFTCEYCFSHYVALFFLIITRYHLLYPDWRGYLVAFFATFTAPIVEEVVYRGVLYSAFQKKFGLAASVIFVTLLFTIVHVPQYSVNGVPDYASVITLLVLSLVLTLIRAKTGNLLPCIVLHTVFNGIQSLFLILEPFLPSSDTTTPDVQGFIQHLFK